MPVEADLFWGISATGWAAIAALGALLAALVSSFTTVFTLGWESARPKVSVQLGSITPYALYAVTPRRRGKWPKDWLPDDGVEAVIVTVENRGRTAMTVATPSFELRKDWADTDQWRRDMKGNRATKTTYALPQPGHTTAESVRIEPFDSAKFALDLSPMFASPTGLRRVPQGLDDWRYVRALVHVSGRRPVRTRTLIEANPTKPQLSGEPVTLRQFLRRWLLLQALLADTDDEMPSAAMASVYAGLVEDGIEKNGGRITQALIEKAMSPRNWGTRELGLNLGFALVEAGFTTHEILLSDEVQLPATPPPAAPKPTTRRERLGWAIALFGRKVAGADRPKATPRT